MEFLTWLGQLLSDLIPPWELVPKTHVGIRQRNLPLPVRFKVWCDAQRERGRTVFGLHFVPEHGIYLRDCGCGFVLKVPFVDEVWQLPVTLESEDLENISAETQDGQVYDISPVLTWKVANPMKACFAVSNYEDSMKNAVRAVIVEWVNRQAGRLDVTLMARECSEQVRKIGAEWGCFAKGVSFNSCNPNWSRQELYHTLVGVQSYPEGVRSYPTGEE